VRIEIVEYFLFVLSLSNDELLAEKK